MTMKTLKILLALVRGLLMALGIGCLVYAPFSGGCMGGGLTFFREQYVALIFVLLLAGLLLLPGRIRLRGKKEMEFIPLNGPGGDIRVSVRVAKNTVQECAAKFDAIRSLEPELSWSSEGLSVVMRLQMQRGRPLTTVCMDLQEAVREIFAGELGIEQLREVRADIIELSAAAKAAETLPVPPPEVESKPEQGA